MAQILVRNVSDAAKARLVRRAEAKGTSLEAEARAILETAAREGLGDSNDADWVAALVVKMRKIGVSLDDGGDLTRNIEAGRRSRKMFKLGDV